MHSEHLVELQHGTFAGKAGFNRFDAGSVSVLSGQGWLSVGKQDREA